MPTYILMTRLSPDVFQDPRGRRELGKEWMGLVEKLCPEVNWLAHYVLLGPYDFMDVYEAPSDEIAHQVSLISRAHGALSAESWPAIPYKDFLNMSEVVEKAVKETRG